MEKRMYFLVPYNISDKQMGIQAGHAALRYARKYAEDDPEVWDFVDNHETWIILNGGTTNQIRDFDGIPQGTMDQYGDQLLENKIQFSYFNEPDLNGALTALCLIADERVFYSSEDYPDFYDWIKEQELFVSADDTYHWNVLKKKHAKIVGKDIAFLKELLNTKKLA
jgi:hypothetical protein